MTEPPAQRPRVGVVALLYNPRYVPRTLDVVHQVARDVAAIETVLVANSDAASAAMSERHSTTTVLRHDNVGLEFGGYQAGIRHLVERHALDWVFIANDTVGNTDPYSAAYHRRFCSTLGGLREAPTIVGRVDAISRSYEIDGCRTHRWIRTNVFALNRPALDLLAHRLYDPEIETLIHAHPDPQRFFDPRLDPVLTDHLKRFMFDAGERWHWYDAQALDPANVERMARKARAILQEKQLSARLDRGGTDFVDIMAMGRQDRLRHKLDTWCFQRRAGVR